MKKVAWLTVLTALVLLVGSIGAAHGEIIPPSGMGQIGYEAVVLCESLTVREKPDASSKAVQTLQQGKVFLVMEQSNGWADVVLSDDVDGAPVGWVNADYIVIDPAWYKTDDKTPVYAWNDTAAPRVALLGKGETMPILKEEGDWLIVGLRGATGWIQKTSAD